MQAHLDFGRHSGALAAFILPRRAEIAARLTPLPELRVKELPMTVCLSRRPLLAALTLYQFVHLIEALHHVAPEWFSGVVTMLGTIVPAIGAAGMALGSFTGGIGTGLAAKALGK